MIEYKSGEELSFMKKSPHSPECVSSMNLDGGTYMKYIQFTKKENEIMDILWKHDIAMSANDIKLASKDLSINTIQQTLQKLLEIKYIKVAGIG